MEYYGLKCIWFFFSWRRKYHCIPFHTVFENAIECPNGYHAIAIEDSVKWTLNYIVRLQSISAKYEWHFTVWAYFSKPSRESYIQIYVIFPTLWDDLISRLMSCTLEFHLRMFPWWALNVSTVKLSYHVLMLHMMVLSKWRFIQLPINNINEGMLGNFMNF